MSKSCTGTKRILVAEEVEVISCKMRAALEAVGYAVEAAADGAECLEKIRSTRPDLVLLDVMMAKVHGIDVMRRVRADSLLQHTGFIVATAKRFKTEFDHVDELGAYAVITKPCQMDELVGTVDSYFASNAFENRPARLTVKESFTGHPFKLDVDGVRGTMTLWGTRGSTPTPGARYLRHGGHTSCMQFQHGEDVLIFDAGSGIRELGLELMKSGPRHIHLFITHTHWDHIQGFPFFVPAYVPGFRIDIYGAEGFGKNLNALFHGQLDRDYFPAQIEDMKAELNFKTLGPEPVAINGAEITWEYSHHPGATVGYKLAVEGTSIAWFPDNEFVQGYIGPPEELTRDHEIVMSHNPVIEFVTGVDILIHEAQYKLDEYRSKIGWGHSSVSNACLLMKLAGIRRWIVTHHDPLHDDLILDGKLKTTKLLLKNLGHEMEVSHGYDGMTEYL